MTSVNSRVAVVTGAASGIGETAARRLHRERWTVAALDVDESGLDRLAGHCPGVHTFGCDVADRDAVPGIIAKIVGELGKPRRLVHCAGIIKASGLIDQDPAESLRMMAVNYGGTVNVVHAVVPVMVAGGGGQVVLIGSLGGWLPMPLGAAYGASKSAVHFFAEALATQERDHGIQVLCVCPPVVETPMIDQLRRDIPGGVTKKGISPSAVLDSVERGLSRRRMWTFPGRGTRTMWLARRLAPGMVSDLIARIVNGTQRRAGDVPATEKEVNP